MAKMDPKQALYQTISLCRRAGALVCGFDAVVDAVMQGKTGLVIASADASENTVKRMRQKVEDLADFRRMPLTQDDIAPVTRRGVAVCAITDDNLAALCRKKLDECRKPEDEEDISV